MNLGNREQGYVTELSEASQDTIRHCRWTTF
jgi:hypothetical protein